jgi:hypothetical protein
LDLYTKVDAEATAPAVATVYEKLVVTKDFNTNSLTFSYNGETVTFSESEIEELKGRGLSEEQIKLRVLDTLSKARDRRMAEQDIPF